MFAIVAFKRELTHRSDPAKNTHEVNWETRSYGCFNGFNDHGNAFSKMQNGHSSATQDLACILIPRRAGATSDAGRMKEYPTTNGTYYNSYAPLDDAGRMAHRLMFAMRNEAQRAEYNRKMQDYTTGPWECLGIGYLANSVGSAIGNGHAHMPYSYSTPGKIHYDPTIGNALKHEGFHEQYYDGETGNMVRSRRVLTPNEKFLSDLCCPYQSAQPTGYVSQDLAQHSGLAAAFANNRNMHGSLYQMVGSERSSGSAVAYLQMYRNTAEFQINGWQGAGYGCAVSLARNILHQLSQTESRVAILDLFTHHGDDSSIISFASNQFAAHVTKYGYFESAFLFRETRSMLLEARYNKGGQSAHIYDRIPNLLNSKSAAEIRAANYPFPELEQFKVNARLANDLTNQVTTQQLNQVRQQVTGTDIHVRAATRVFSNMRVKLEEYFRFDPRVAMTSWVNAMRAFPDLRAPTVPDSAVNGSSSGFREWISTAMNTATVH